VQGAGCRVQGAGCKVQGARCRVQGARCRVQGAGCRVQGAGCRVQGAGYRLQVVGFIAKNQEFSDCQCFSSILEMFQVSGNRHQATGPENRNCRILKRVIPTIRRKAERRELVINKNYQRFGILILPMNEVKSLPLRWQELNKLLPIANRQRAINVNGVVKPACQPELQ
jgi:hypothetical protein